MKKLILTALVLAFPAISFAATTPEDYVKFTHDNNVDAGAYRLTDKGAYEPIRGQDMTYDAAMLKEAELSTGENKIWRRDLSKTEDVTLPGVEPGYCVHWKTCQKEVYNAIKGHNYKKEGDDAKYGTRYLKVRNAREDNNKNELNGERSGVSKLFRYFYQK